jgi:hypothetical protein
MEELLKLISQSGFAHMDWGNWVMYALSATLVFLAVKKEYEPLLLIPIAFGIVLANFPLAEMGSYGEGIIALIYTGGIKTELLPPLIFLGVGVLTDFRPLLGRPITFLLGAAAQLGILVAALAAAHLFGFSTREESLAGLTAPRPFFWRASWHRTCWVRWRSAPTATWRWSPLFNHPSFALSPPRRNGQSTCRRPARSPALPFSCSPFAPELSPHLRSHPAHRLSGC